MLENKKIKNVNYVTTFMLILGLTIITPIEAALVGWHFQSSNWNNSATAVGFVQWDDAIAAQVNPFDAGYQGPLSELGVTQFSWVATGGVHDGIKLTMDNTSGLIWDNLSNNLDNDFGFYADEDSRSFQYKNFDTGFPPKEMIVFGPYYCLGYRCSMGEGQYIRYYTHHSFVKAEVPLPAAIAMFVPGVVGLFAFSRRLNNSR